MSDPAENVAVNDTLAVRLLISRRDLKFNQEDVADRAGVSGAYVSDLERGKVDNPTLDVVTSLARVLQVRPEYLLGWSDDAAGEDRPGNVAEGRVVYEVNGPAEYRRVQELLELFNELTPEDQRILWEIAGRLRRAGDVRIVGE